MNDPNVLRDMRTSMNRISIVMPVIKQMLGDGTLYAVEGDDNTVCKMLDETCGVDYYYKIPLIDGTDATYGVASRIQTRLKPNGDPWNSFTVRVDRESGKPTELQKRISAIKTNTNRPQLFMQAYINPDTNELLSVAIAYDDDVQKLAKLKGDREDKHVSENGRNATLRPVWWSEMIENEKQIFVYHKGEITRYVPDRS